MTVKKFTAYNYRNLKNVCVELSDGINVFYGENGQGKTNIIEGLWLFTGCHSFRTSRCSELILDGSKQARLSLDFLSADREQTAEITINSKREVMLNEIIKPSPRYLLGVFRAVVFSPSMLAIIQDGPSERRKFLDVAISMIKPGYAKYLTKYIKAITQRNALLKQMSQGRFDEDVLIPWDDEIAKLGAKIIQYRLKYIEDIADICEDIYAGFSGGREHLKLKYVQSGTDSIFTDEYQIVETLYNSLEKNRSGDVKRMFTSVGPHKDDLVFEIDGLNAKNYGSQGQQRSCALALKISEASVIKKYTDEYPVALLDDVMSELDVSRQEFLIKYLRDWQVLITCCDPSQLSRIKDNKTFRVENGNIY
ncbi:MAG: DNA replication/repair protein RecF [Clostridiales bacterium]|nr:DNA replication/repair protein RecF [Clostridiales bacterium]